jgi:hypothetical protein
MRNDEKRGREKITSTIKQYTIEKFAIKDEGRLFV